MNPSFTPRLGLCLFLLLPDSRAAGPGLTWRPNPAPDATVATLRVTLAQPPSAYTLLAADSLADLADNAQPLIHGDSSVTVADVPLSLAASRTRFFRVREVPLGTPSEGLVGGSAGQSTAQVGPVRITLPVGWTEGPQPVSVALRGASTANIPSGPSQPLFGTLREIRVGTNEVFEQSVTAEIPFEPRLADPGLPLEHAVTAAYWDPEIRRWIRVPTTVDPVRNTLTFATRHFSLWTDLYYWGYELGFSPKGHFKVYYKKGSDLTLENPPSTMAAAEAGGRAATALDAAWERYVAAGYWDPPLAMGPLPVVFTDDANESAFEIDKFQGVLFLARRAANVAQFELGAAHEFFHWIQADYAGSIAGGLATFLRNQRWWYEACADYASRATYAREQPPFAVIHNPDGSVSMEYFNTTYFMAPLTTFDGAHEYGTANFIAFVMARSSAANFADLFAATRTYRPSGMLSRIGAYLGSTTGMDLDAWYRAFAADAILGASGYLGGPNNTIAPLNLRSRLTLAVNAPPQTNRIEVLPANGTAQLINVLVPVAADKKVRNLKATLVDATGTPNVELYRPGTRWLFDSGPPAAAFVWQSLRTSQRLTVTPPAEYVAFLCSNTGSEDASLTLVLEDDLDNSTRDLEGTLQWPNFLAGSALLVVNPKVTIRGSEDMFVGFKTNVDLFGSPASYSLSAARRGNLPTEVTLNPEFTLLLRTSPENREGSGNDTWVTKNGLAGYWETTLSNPHLVVGSTVHPIPATLSFDPNTQSTPYIRLVFDYSQTYFEYVNKQPVRRTENHGTGVEGASVLLVQLNIYP